MPLQIIDTFFRFLFVVCLVFVLCIPNVRAQESLSLSVTPPLIQVNLSPDDDLKSGVKIINSNPYEITVWADVVNFSPIGEDGHGRFTPVIGEEVDSASLASWIEVVSGPYTIPAEQSLNVPFTVAVPADAPPGGHSAAILIGTRPPENDSTLAVRTSQVVTTLFFVRIAGDVEERGSVREFSVVHSFSQIPKADFLFRFQNDGNVHLQPQGDITIYNMWGKERGFIPINQESGYGNVLPNSIRQYHFSWRGEQSVTDIGRYRAELTVGFGQDARRFVDAAAFFWVIPIKATLITLTVVFLFVAFIVWAIRRYIRRAMYMAGIDPDSVPKKEKDTQTGIQIKKKAVSRKDLVAPLRAGVIDLRTRIEDDEQYETNTAAVTSFISQYKIFIISVLVFVIGIALLVWFILDAKTSERDYEVTIPGSGGQEIISSEEIIKDRLEDSKDLDGEESVVDEAVVVAVDQDFVLRLVNASGEPGTAARVALELEALGYEIDGISTDNDREQGKTVIVSTGDTEKDAIALSEKLGNALISHDASSGEEGIVTIIVGADRKGE